MVDDEIYLDADEIADDIAEEQSSSKTYKIDFENSRIIGTVDGEEAVQQMVYKALKTERFNHLIYSDDYGCEIKKILYSDETDQDYIASEIERTITETLEVDDRVLSIEDFNITFNDDVINVSFIIETSSGTTKIEVIY